LLKNSEYGAGRQNSAPSAIVGGGDGEGWTTEEAGGGRAGEKRRPGIGGEESAKGINRPLAEQDRGKKALQGCQLRDWELPAGGV